MTDGAAGRDADMVALAKGGRTNILGFVLRLLARLPFLFIAGRIYGPDVVGRFAVAVLAVEFAGLISTLGLKRGLAQALSETDRPHAHVAWDAVVIAALAATVAGAVLALFPQLMFPNSAVNRFDRLLALGVVALTVSDISLAALAYRHNVRASVTARAVIEPWTISIAAWALSYYSIRDGLILAYALSTLAALAASLAPFVRSYGWPRAWRPSVLQLLTLARANAPLAGADTIEWATRNVDRAILSLAFAPSVVGIYYMAQQVASLPQKLKTSFDPILGPVITSRLHDNDLAAVARQVCQVGFWIIAAQTGLALMGAIPARGVMGVVGPQFVIGATALVFLLIAEVVAVTGSVSESALVYIARRRNLVISVCVLATQIALTFALIYLLRGDEVPLAWQTASPAVALAIALALGSVAKAVLLSRLLGSRVAPWRWSIVLAAVAAGLVGSFATRWAEWAELVIGVPLIALTYLGLLWLVAFGPQDRALFARA